MLEAVTQFFSPLGLDFMQRALAAGLLVGCACAYLGVFLILKRIVFVGAALSEIAAAGLALGFFLHGFLGHHEEFGLLGHYFPGMVSFLVTLGGIVFFWIPWAERRVSRESLIGYAYAAATAVAVLIVAKNPGGEMHDLDLLSGNLLFVNGRDIFAIGVVVVLVGALHLLLHKEFVFVSFDLETARTLGLPARFYDFLIYLSIGATISVAMDRVGVLFVFASLILPALAGLLLGRRMATVSLFSLVTAAVGVTAGLLLSFLWDLPTGPMVVLCYAVLFLLAAGIAALRRHG